MAQLLSIQVGKSQNYPGDHSNNILTRAWSTSFYKTPVEGKIELSHYGLSGDSVTDKKNHGGLDKAVLAYSGDHYPEWQTEHGLEVSPGCFGENFTVQGLDEKQVTLGERWQVGTAILEVSQPRQPCWKLARRHMLTTLPKTVLNVGYTGWYLRVITPGEITAQTEIVVLAQPYPAWTIARLNSCYYGKQKDLSSLQEVVLHPELSTSWRDDFLGMIEA